MKEFSKEEVRELFNEYKDVYRYTDYTDRFLKSKGLLEEELEKGVWYKHYIEDWGDLFFNYQGKKGSCAAYGFDRLGNWSESIGVNDNMNYVKATKEEIEPLLIAEAKKRGLVEGVEAKCCYSGDLKMVIKNGNHFEGLDLWSNKGRDLCLFDNETGKWATPIESEEMTLSEVCKELKRNIKIVK